MKENESIAKSAFGRIGMIKDQLLGSGLIGGITMIGISAIPGQGARAWVFTICGPALVIFVVIVYVLRGNGAPSSGQEAAVENTVPRQIAADKKKRLATGTPNRRKKKTELAPPPAAPVLEG
ncbi:MAG TPA: hypothetical protein VGO11_16980 [Chthoniobacteraceae bacterium]|nr:hypothetical protein [Chthoniobacteraceae bacterium]